MISNGMEKSSEQGSRQPGESRELVLRSELSEMGRLPPWIDEIVMKFGLEERLNFAINLCLEEVVSNVIRHGYASDDERLVTIHCGEYREGQIVFTVEDDAAPFNPLEAGELPAVGLQDTGQLGGQGIRLLRAFADTLEYESKAGGNRLRMGFRSAATSLSSQVTPN
jgi:anti-sigma regulatory factor (Ser/Thr protein kinase)